MQENSGDRYRKDVNTSTHSSIFPTTIRFCLRGCCVQNPTYDLQSGQTQESAGLGMTQGKGHIGESEVTP